MQWTWSGSARCIDKPRQVQAQSRAKGQPTS